MSNPARQLKIIQKADGGATAIKKSSLDLHPAKVVALLGDNGAGKSMLIKMIYGVQIGTRETAKTDKSEIVATISGACQW